MARFNIMKIVFYAFNAVDIIFAIALIAVGSYAISHQSLTSVTVPTGITTIGVLVMLAAFFGIFAACKESKANTILLSIYIIIMGLLVLLLFIIGCVVAYEKGNAQSYVLDGWKALAPSSKTQFQYNWMCCGGSTYNDTYTGPGCPDPTQLPISRRGCVPVIAEGLMSAFNVAGGCGIAFAVIMFLGLIISGILLRKARLGYREEQYKTGDGGSSIIETDAASI